MIKNRSRQVPPRPQDQTAHRSLNTTPRPKLPTEFPTRPKDQATTETTRRPNYRPNSQQNNRKTEPKCRQHSTELPTDWHTNPKMKKQINLKRTTSLRHRMARLVVDAAVVVTAVWGALVFFELGEARDRCFTRMRQVTPGVRTPPHLLHKESITQSGRLTPLAGSGWCWR